MATCKGCYPRFFISRAQCNYRGVSNIVFDKKSGELSAR